MKTTPNHTLTHALRLCAMTAALFTVDAFAQSNASDMSKSNNTHATGKPELTHTDKHFVEKAVTSGREEVDISRVAAERATNADVKQFAQMMVDDHTRANDELVAFAQAHSIEVKEKKSDADKWSKKDAKDFDRDYVKKMVSDHKDAVDLFRNEAKDGTDPELVELARKTLPKLEQHYEKANDLKKMIK
jgi:putative membrane protein